MTPRLQGVGAQKHVFYKRYTSDKKNYPPRHRLIANTKPDYTLL